MANEYKEFKQQKSKHNFKMQLTTERIQEKLLNEPLPPDIIVLQPGQQLFAQSFTQNLRSSNYNQNITNYTQSFGGGTNSTFNLPTCSINQGPVQYQWTDEFDQLKLRFFDELKVVELILKHAVAASSQDNITMSVKAFYTKQVFRNCA